jgi:glycosyltransferase involved in cell wall biosynthesis
MKKKIIHTLPSTHREASGPTYSVVRLCETMNKIGLLNELITLDSPKQNYPSFQKVFPYGFGPKKLGNSPLMKDWLEMEVKLGNVLLFHNHSLWMMPNVYPGNIASKYDIPYVVSPRGCFTRYAMSIGPKIKKLFWLTIQNPSLKSTTMFHATAFSEYEDIRRLGFKQPIAIIPNGIDIPIHQRMDKNNSFRNLLFLGRLHPNKGIEILLKAWYAVQNNYLNWRLLIVGPDENGHLEYLKSIINELKIQRVDFLGPIYGEQKWELYNSSDLFILPSHSENFGMTIAEALASGIPAIVFKGAPWERLIEKKAGWWIDNDLNVLIECLKNVLNYTPEELRFFGNNGKLWMENDFTWDIIAEKMKKSYEWLLYNIKKPDWIFVD